MNIDEMFGLLSAGPTWASLILGFVLVAAVVIIGVVAFGKSKQELGAFGFMVLVFIGALLATLVGLFPAYILLILIIVPMAFMVIKKISGGSSNV